MDRLGKRFPVNAKSSGNVSFEEPRLILSMNVRYSQAKGILQFDQSNAIEKIAERFGVASVLPRTLPISPDDVDLPKLKMPEVDANNYLSILGSCLHIAQVSRSDISFAVGTLSRHSATPGEMHLQAALDLVRYLNGSKRLYIQYTRKDTGDKNDPKVFGKGFRPEYMVIEQRLVASVPDVSKASPTLSLMRILGEIRTRANRPVGSSS